MVDTYTILKHNISTRQSGNYWHIHLVITIHFGQLKIQPSTILSNLYLLAPVEYRDINSKRFPKILGNPETITHIKYIIQNFTNLNESSVKYDAP